MLSLKMLKLFGHKRNIILFITENKEKWLLEHIQVKFGYHGKFTTGERSQI